MSQADEAEYDREDLIKITKFELAHNLMTLVIIHRDSGAEIFRYDSPMTRINAKIFDLAVTQAKALDLLFGELKALADPTGYTIIILEGNYVRCIVILNVDGFTPLISQYGQVVLREFLEEFENQYRDTLREWSGAGKLSNVVQILDDVLQLRMNLPFQAKYQGFEPDSATGRTVFEAADKITRKIGYFYLANLIGITKRHVVEKEEEKQRWTPELGGKKQKKKKKKKKRKKKKKKDKDAAKAPSAAPAGAASSEKKQPPEVLDHVPGTDIVFPPEEEFFIAIFNLVKLGLLEPIPIEDIDSYAKIDYSS